MFKNNVKVIKKCQVRTSNMSTALEHSDDSWNMSMDQYKHYTDYLNLSNETLHH